jgi:tetratricopeptide (TPR) repeat protein
LEDMVPLVKDEALLKRVAADVATQLANAKPGYERSEWARILGELQLARGQPKEAVAAFEEAIKISAGDSQLRQRLNKAMWAAGRRDEADLMSANNFPIFEFRDRLRTLSLEGDTDRVIQLASRQMEVLTQSSRDPRFQRHYDQDLIIGYVVEILTRLGRTEELDRFLAKESARRPNSADTLAALARRKDANNERDAAIELMEKAVLAFPGNGNHLEELAALYRKAKRQDALDGFLRRATDKHPDAPFPAKALVQWYCERGRTNEARGTAVFYREAIERTPSDRSFDWKQSSLVDMLAMIGDFDGAITAARKAMELARGNKATEQKKLAELYRRAGKTNELAQLTGGNNALLFDNLLDQFREETRANKFDAAINTARQILAFNPSSKQKRDDAWSLFWDELRSTRQQDRLLTLVRELLKNSPKDFELLRRRAIIALQQSDFNKSAEYWERAHEVDPGNAEAIHNLAESYNRLRRFTNTIALLGAGPTSGTREHSETDLLLAQAYHGVRDTNGLLRLASQFEQRATNGPERMRSAPLRDLAKVLDMLGRHDDAARHMRRVIADPNSWSAYDYTFLVQQYKLLGKLDQALRACLDGMADPGNSTFLKSELGPLYLLKGMTNEANAAFDALEAPSLALIRSGKADAATFNRVAWFYVTKKIQPARAVEYAKRAVSLKPKEFTYRDTLGWALLRNQEYADALSIFSQVVTNFAKADAASLKSSWNGVSEIARMSVVEAEFLAFVDSVRPGVAREPKHAARLDEVLTQFTRKRRIPSNP